MLIRWTSRHRVSLCVLVLRYRGERSYSILGFALESNGLRYKFVIKESFSAVRNLVVAVASQGVLSSRETVLSHRGASTRSARTAVCTARTTDTQRSADAATKGAQALGCTPKGAQALSGLSQNGYGHKALATVHRGIHRTMLCSQTLNPSQESAGCLPPPSV